jgi:anti-anti-sigma regulatory factor
MAEPVQWSWQAGALVVEGDLDGGAADAVVDGVTRAWARRGDRDVLDLTDLDVDDGVANARMVDLVRALRDAAGGIVVEGAPQMLAHVLYKVGDLEDGRIRLLHPRSDEGGPVD